jgi:hypothetical protein
VHERLFDSYSELYWYDDDDDDDDDDDEKLCPYKIMVSGA